MNNLIYGEIALERSRQDAEWGVTDHPDGTGSPSWIEEAYRARNYLRWLGPNQKATWQDILYEETAETFAERDPKAVRRRLFMVAAVAVAWIEAIERRPVEELSGE